MLPSCVVCVLPSRICDRSFPDLDNTIASRETDCNGSIDEFDVRPLESMAVNIVGDFAEKYPVFLQNPKRFAHEWRIEMIEVVTLFK